MFAKYMSWSPQKRNKNNMMTSSKEIFFVLLALCEGNPLATGGFPSKSTVTRGIDALFDVPLNNFLNKQWSCWWLENKIFENTTRTRYISIFPKIANKLFEALGKTSETAISPWPREKFKSSGRIRWSNMLNDHLWEYMSVRLWKAKPLYTVYFLFYFIGIGPSTALCHIQIYRQTYYISRILVGDKIVDHPLGATYIRALMVPTSTTNSWLLAPLTRRILSGSRNILHVFDGFLARFSLQWVSRISFLIKSLPSLQAITVKLFSWIEAAYVL